MFILPELPYDHDALAPVISADTLRTHHGKHHAAYVEKANSLAKKAGLGELALEELIGEARRRGERPLFNNAAQAWNHGFFWLSMSPAPTAPAGALKAAIDQAFGGQAGLKDAFVDEAAAHFASGWAWLVAGSGGGLKVISTHDADSPVSQASGFPLLVCDLWEHAYYLDYRNDRPAYLNRWFDEVADWSFAGRQLAASQGQGRAYRYPSTAEAGG